MGLFSSSKSKTTSTSYLPVQAEWMKNIVPAYGEQVGEGQPIYPGQRVASMTPVQQQALELGGWSQYLTPGMGPMYGETGAALSDILSGQMGGEPYTEQAVNDLFKSAYEQPAKKGWSEFVQPTIREAYSGPGFWGTSRMKAEQEGAQDIQDWLGTQYGNLRWGAEEANRGLAEAKAGRALSAIPVGLEYGAAPTQQAQQAIAGRQALYGLGSAEQQQQQAQIAADWGKWIEQQRITDPEVLNTILQLLGMNYSSSTSKTTGPGIGYSMGTAFAGGVGEGMGAAMMAM